MDLQDPNFLFHLLWLLPLVALLVWRASRLRRKRLRAFVADRNAVTDASAAKRGWRAALLGAALALAVLAGARPQWGTELVKRPVQARDVMVVLDCSRSMLAKDVAPSRLRHAKMLIRKLVSQSPGDRFGLVAFSGSAFLECPLTQDRSGFLLFLDDVTTETIPIGGTNLEEALSTALAGFEAAEGRHRAILLVTDGDELTGNVAVQTKACVEAGVTVLAVGLGDPELGSFLQLEDNSFIVDKNGDRVRSRLNEASLRSVSTATGGFYVRSTPMYDGLDQLLAKVRALVPEGRSDQTVARPMARYQGPLALALILLLVRMGLGERRTAALLVAAAVCGAMTPTPVWAADSATDGADAPPAAVAAATTAQARAFAWYNEGVRLMAEDADAARKAFESAGRASGGDERLAAAIAQNLGALTHAQGRDKMLQSAMSGKKEAPTELVQAASQYRQSLQAGGSDGGAGSNLEQALLDMKRYEQMRAAFEQLRQQQQEARDALEDAAQQQDDANKAEGDRSIRQQQAADATKKAGEKLDDLAEALEQAGASDAAQALNEQVQEQIRQARQAQERAQESVSPQEREGHEQEAAAALQRALDQMGAPESQGQDGDSGQDGEGDNQQNAEDDTNGDNEGEGDGENERDGENGRENDSRQSGKPEGAQAEAANGEPSGKQAGGELDKEQALRILEANQRRERDLKRLMKERMRQSAAAREVERDW